MLLLLPILSAGDVQVAQQKLLAGRYFEALQEFREVTEETPSRPGGWIGLARSYAGLGQCKQAIEVIAPWRSSGAYNARAAVVEGWCWYRLGEYEQARETADDALLLKPNLAPALYLRGLAEAAIGDSFALALTLEELQPTLRGEIMVPLAQGWDAVERGDEADLLAAMQTLSALTLVYADSGVPHQLALMDAQRALDVGDPLTAYEGLSVTLDSTGDQVRVQILRAEALRRMGRAPAALAVFRAPNLRPRNSALPRAIRVRVLVDLGRTDAAVQRFADLLASPHPEDAASGWYLARAVGDEVREAQFREAWQVLNQNPDRTLEQLIPVAPQP
ncbi:MAG: tetratricopeptide (TPR) repeat protein [Myxococcota bacterium]